MRYYTVSVKPESKRKINPYTLRKTIAIWIGDTLESIATSGREAFMLKIRTLEESQRIEKMNKVVNIECKGEKHKLYNQSRGLIYIYEFDLDNIQEFSEGLQTEYNISKVELVTFIKSKNLQTKIFLVTFEQEYAPEFIFILGERSDARVTFQITS